MMVNDALFKLNLNAGFVLKPSFLRGNPTFDLNNSQTWPEAKQLTMKILSGRQMQRGSERVDPKVKVSSTLNNFIRIFCGKYKSNFKVDRHIVMDAFLTYR